MRKRLVQLSFALAAPAVFGVLAHQGMAAEAENEGGATSLMGRLQGLVRQLRELRQDYYEQKARDDAEIEAARRNRALLHDQLAALREQEATLDAEIADYRSQVDDLDVQLDIAAQMRALVDGEVTRFTSAQVKQIEAGIPYQQERRIARLRAALPDANDVAALSVSGRMEHLWSYTEEEMRLAGSSETYTGRADIGGNAQPYARYFRVGLSFMGYVTEDGQTGAVWLDGPTGGRWQAISDPKQLAQLRDAVDVLDRRQAPRFVSLPIVLGIPDADEKSPQ